MECDGSRAHLKVYEYEGAVATTALAERYIDRDTNEYFMIYDL